MLYCRYHLFGELKLIMVAKLVHTERKKQTKTDRQTDAENTAKQNSMLYR